MKLEVEVEEGDVVIFNHDEWKVENFEPVMGTYNLIQAGTGEARNFTREELQNMVDYSGQFKLVKEDYIGL